MRNLIVAGILFAGVALVFAAAPADDGDQQSPVGTVASVRLGNDDLSKDRHDQLHFCVFDNGDDDYIYVGTKYGMWSNGKFDLSIDGERVFTGRVPHMVYGGAIIDMGDVLDEQPRSNIGVHITRITGTFK
ncbi:MAG: hypothetical protein AAGI37_19325 [Planctomycetota bacterium]